MPKNSKNTIAAVSDGLSQTIAVVEGMQRSEYLLESLYHDEDLGPLLQSEPFRSFRDRFPPPKPKGEAEGIDEIDF